MALWTADLAAIRSIHIRTCGNSLISSSVYPQDRQFFTNGQVPMSATEYRPLFRPARYSQSTPVYLPDSRISRIPKTLCVSFLYRLILTVLGLRGPGGGGAAGGGGMD